MTLEGLTRAHRTHICTHYREANHVSLQAAAVKGRQDCCMVIWRRFPGGEEIDNQLFTGHFLILAERKGRH
jgi:hypothetical protein